MHECWGPWVEGGEGERFWGGAVCEEVVAWRHEGFGSTYQLTKKDAQTSGSFRQPLSKNLFGVV